MRKKKLAALGLLFASAFTLAVHAEESADAESRAITTRSTMSWDSAVVQSVITLDAKKKGHCPPDGPRSRPPDARHGNARPPQRFPFFGARKLGRAARGLRSKREGISLTSLLPGHRLRKKGRSIFFARPQERIDDARDHARRTRFALRDALKAVRAQGAARDRENPALYRNSDRRAGRKARPR